MLSNATTVAGTHLRTVAKYLSRRVQVATVVSALFVMAVATGRAQALSDQPTVVQCSDCTLVASRVARLGADADGPEFNRLALAVIRDSRGRIIAGPISSRAQFAVYSPSGKLLKVVGSAGSGPGEFRNIGDVVVTPGDSLVVFDVELRRLSIFDPEFRYVRSFPFSPHRRLTISADGTLYGVGNLRSGTSVGFAVHRYSLKDGARAMSFEEDTALLKGDDSSLNNVFVAGQVAPDLFMVRDEPYKIVRRDSKGVSVPFKYQPSWLPYPRTYRSKAGRPGTAELLPEPPILLEPRPHVRGLRIERDGNLWISGSVAKADWRKYPNPHEPAHAREGKRNGSPAPFNPVNSYERVTKWYTNVIDIVSVKDAKLVDRARLPFTTGWLLGEGYVAGAVVNDDGALIIEVWRLSRPK